jgi:hypothetical protein
MDRMRISPLAEMVIKDLDDLRENATGLARIWTIGQNAYPPQPWYVAFPKFLRDRWRTYERSLQRLYMLLQLERWNELQRRMAIWEAIKIAYGRDFFDGLQEQKEREMNRLTQNVRTFMKMIGEVLLEYKNLFGLESDGAPVRPEAEAYISQILAHPSDEYRSYFERYDDAAADASKRIRNLREIREKALAVFRRTSPELCELIERTEEDLFSTIRLTDRQESTEPVDLRLIDSVLKCACTHNPACYEEGARMREPAMFAKQILSCPNLVEVLDAGPQGAAVKVRAFLMNHLGPAVDALVTLYLDHYIPIKHRKALKGVKDYRTFEEETLREHLAQAGLKT